MPSEALDRLFPSALVRDQITRKDHVRASCECALQRVVLCRVFIGEDYVDCDYFRSLEALNQTCNQRAELRHAAIGGESVLIDTNNR
jgi:hypothetical protein